MKDQECSRFSPWTVPGRLAALRVDFSLAGQYNPKPPVPDE